MCLQQVKLTILWRIPFLYTDYKKVWESLAEIRFPYACLKLIVMNPIT